MEIIENYGDLNSEFDHTCAITTGMVELVESIEKETELTPNACFANTVLVLNDVDLPSLAGQEGFWDGVKKGTTKVYEWIKQLIRTFRDWFNGKTKRRYEEAEKNLEKDGVDIDDKIAELAKAFVMNTTPTIVPKEVVIPSTAPIMRRVENADLKVIVAKFKEEMEVKEEAGDIKSDVDTAYEAIAAKMKNGMSAIGTQIAELKRIDPTGETQRRISIKIDYEADLKLIESVLGWIPGKDPTQRIEALSKSVVVSAKAAQFAAARAAVNVEKMNEKAKGNPDATMQSELSRSVSVMKVVTEIAARYRDLVITMDSASLIAAAKIVDAGIRNAVVAAMGEVSERSAEYLQQAMDELGM